MSRELIGKKLLQALVIGRCEEPGPCGLWLESQRLTRELVSPEFPLKMLFSSAWSKFLLWPFRRLRL